VHVPTNLDWFETAEFFLFKAGLLICFAHTLYVLVKHKIKR